MCVCVCGGGVVSMCVCVCVCVCVVCVLHVCVWLIKINMASFMIVDNCADQLR